MFLKVDPSLTTTKDIHSLLLSAVGPRPIALASTIDKNGVRNISPFSFFNVFSITEYISYNNTLFLPMPLKLNI